MVPTGRKKKQMGEMERDRDMGGKGGGTQEGETQKEVCREGRPREKGVPRERIWEKGREPGWRKKKWLTGHPAHTVI